MDLSNVWLAASADDIVFAIIGVFLVLSIAGGLKYRKFQLKGRAKQKPKDEEDRSCSGS